MLIIVQIIDNSIYVDYDEINQQYYNFDIQRNNN